MKTLSDIGFIMIMIAKCVEIVLILETSFWGMGISSCLASSMIGKAKNEGKHVVIECELEQRSGIRIAEKYGIQKSGIID